MKAQIATNPETAPDHKRTSTSGSSLTSSQVKLSARRYVSLLDAASKLRAAPSEPEMRSSAQTFISIGVPKKFFTLKQKTRPSPDALSYLVGRASAQRASRVAARIHFPALCLRSRRAFDDAHAGKGASPYPDHSPQTRRRRPSRPKPASPPISSGNAAGTGTCADSSAIAKTRDPFARNARVD